MKPINRHYSILLIALMSSAVAQVAMAADLVCVRCVDTTDLNYNAVTTNRILDGSVRTADLGMDAVTSTRIRDREVKTQDIDSYAVTTVKLGQYAVTTSKIINGAVTEAKLAQALLDRLNQLEAKVTALEAENAAQKAFLDYFSFQELHDPSTGNNYPTVRVTGANLQVVNGLNDTETINGTGNLIVGYNQDSGVSRCSEGQYTDETSCTAGGAIWSDQHRSGSHNIVGGEANNYSQYGGLIVGYSNTINGKRASISGGINNTASGTGSSVSGGRTNTASGAGSNVSGGQSNTASAQDTSVLGGFANTASGFVSTISGGYHNTASGAGSNVSGGETNTASGYKSSVSGGLERSAPDDHDWAAGALFQDQ